MSANIRKQTGRIIKARRLHLGLTQKDVAEVIKCSRENISYIETGRQDLSLSNFLKLCAFLSLAPSEVVGWIAAGKGGPGVKT